MTDIEERFAGNGDDGSLIERQLLSRANVQRKLCVRPAKNRLAYPTPLRFAGISQTMIPGLSPSHLQSQMQIAIRLDFHSINRARKGERFVFDSYLRILEAFSKTSLSDF